MYDDFLASLAEKHMQISEVLERALVGSHAERIQHWHPVQVASGARHSAVDFFSGLARPPDECWNVT